MEEIEVNNKRTESAGGATRKVYRGILRALDTHDLVPGQRLIEADLAAEYGVGRNAVREAIQLLAGRGVVDLSRHRSAAIRQLDLAETLEVLDVSEVLIGLLVRKATEHFDPATQEEALAEAVLALERAHEGGEAVDFNRARRGFYRTLLSFSHNREMQRLFPAVGMHIIHARYQSARLQRIRHADYLKIAAAIRSGDPDYAEAVAREHTGNVRTAILELSGA
jgi:DNA-binding GntR family transcriptional regulator